MSYQDVKDKLYHGHMKIANNTHLILHDHLVDYDAIWVDMRLHGNVVARFTKDYLQLFSAGWHTTTTKDRLNLAISLARINENNLTKDGKLLKFYKIYQVDHQWYYGNYHKYDPKFYDGMKIDYTGRVIN